MTLNDLLGESFASARGAIPRRRLPGPDSRHPRGQVAPLDAARFAGDEPVRTVRDEPVRTVQDVGADDGEAAFPGEPRHTSFWKVSADLRPRGDALSGLYGAFRDGRGRRRVELRNALFDRAEP